MSHCPATVGMDARYFGALDVEKHEWIIPVPSPIPTPRPPPDAPRSKRRQRDNCQLQICQRTSTMILMLQQDPGSVPWRV